MNVKRERWQIVIAGLIIGVIAALLVYFGNPSNMGFCIACFLRDTAGGLGLHRAAAVQYIRPEIIGLVLGSFIVALYRRATRRGSFMRADPSPLFTTFCTGHPIFISINEYPFPSIFFAISAIITGSEPKS